MNEIRLTQQKNSLPMIIFLLISIMGLTFMQSASSFQHNVDYKHIILVKRNPCQQSETSTPSSHYSSSSVLCAIMTEHQWSMDSIKVSAFFHELGFFKHILFPEEIFKPPTK